MALVLKGVMQSPVTPLKDDFSPDLATFERLLDVHVHRRDRVDDVAEAARYLASPTAAFITGHTLVLDGGLNVA